MFTEAQNAAIVRTELDFVFMQEFGYDDTTPGIATANSGELFKPQYTTHAAEIYEVFKGVGYYSQTGEVGTVPLDTPKVANKVFVNVLDWTKGVELSKDMFDDNMHGVWARIVADMARKARVTQDYNAFGLFRGGFTTTLTADGVAWFSASHVLLNGQTISNLVTNPSGTGLTSDSLYAMIVALRQQVDQAGVLLGNSPSILLVPTKLFKKATELTDSALIADTANNAINVYRSAYGFKVMTSPFLDLVVGGSDTAYFLLSSNHAATRLIRQGIQTSLRSWEYSNNRTYFYQANFRESYYVPDYVGAVAISA